MRSRFNEFNLKSLSSSFQRARFPSLSRIINLPMERTFWQFAFLFHIPLRLVELAVGCKSSNFTAFWMPSFFRLSVWSVKKCWHPFPTRLYVQQIHVCNSWNVGTHIYGCSICRWRKRVYKLPRYLLLCLRVLCYRIFYEQFNLPRKFSLLFESICKSSIDRLKLQLI